MTRTTLGGGRGSLLDGCNLGIRTQPFQNLLEAGAVAPGTAAQLDGILSSERSGDAVQAVGT
jgi:hypothetical protein